MGTSDVSAAKVIGGLLLVMSLLGGFFGTYRWIDARYALADELAKVEKRLDVKIVGDQRFDVRKEIRQLEELNLGKKIEQWKKQDRDRYNELLDQLKDLQDKLKKLQ